MTAMQALLAKLPKAPGAGREMAQQDVMGASIGSKDLLKQALLKEFNAIQPEIANIRQEIAPPPVPYTTEPPIPEWMKGAVEQYPANLPDWFKDKGVETVPSAVSEELKGRALEGYPGEVPQELNIIHQLTGSC